jgi:hypothetical protein
MEAALLRRITSEPDKCGGRPCIRGCAKCNHLATAGLRKNVERVMRLPYPYPSFDVARIE